MQLVYNEAHPGVMKKTDRLHLEANNFPAVPAPEAVSELYYIHTTRAETVRQGLNASKEYWRAYDAKMTRLHSNTTMFSQYEFELLPSQPAAALDLPVEGSDALESLRNTAVMRLNFSQIMAGLGDAKPAKGSLAAAYCTLEEAVQLDHNSEHDRIRFRPDSVKYLCKPGLRKQPGPAWDRTACSVGNLVLVRVEPEMNEDGRAWDLAVILDPVTRHVQDRDATALHVPAGVPGRDKVSTEARAARLL